jgi:predicted SnoaL-like aldol condensation-catalyzing enzyme
VTPKELVLRGTTELFGDHDLSAIDRYWAADYIEHSTLAGPGRHSVREAAGSLPAGFRHERLRVLSEDDLVVMHGLYHGLGPIPIVGCDLWRVADGKIVEHWDARQPWAEQPVSGHTMTDGPVMVTEPEKTAASKKLVEQFAELIMMGGDRTQITRFFDSDRFIQHNPQIADGVSGLANAIQAGVWAAVVAQVHHIVADGEFVFTQGEGTLHGIPTAFYDLFRVENDKLAEHWDIVFAKPDTLPHSNGLF